MFKANKKMVLEAIQELSDKDYQEYCWRGYDQSVMCVPEELYESLFNGSKFAFNVNAGKSVFGGWDDRIMALGERFACLLDTTDGEIEAILTSAEMAQIRTEAKLILTGLGR